MPLGNPTPACESQCNPVQEAFLCLCVSGLRADVTGICFQQQRSQAEDEQIRARQKGLWRVKSTQTLSAFFSRNRENIWTRQRHTEVQWSDTEQGFKLHTAQRKQQRVRCKTFYEWMSRGHTVRVGLVFETCCQPWRKSNIFIIIPNSHTERRSEKPGYIYCRSLRRWWGDYAQVHQEQEPGSHTQHTYSHTNMETDKVGTVGNTMKGKWGEGNAEPEHKLNIWAWWGVQIQQCEKCFDWQCVQRRATANKSAKHRRGNLHILFFLLIMCS